MNALDGEIVLLLESALLLLSSGTAAISVIRRGKKQYQGPNGSTVSGAMIGENMIWGATNEYYDNTGNLHSFTPCAFLPDSLGIVVQADATEVVEGS